MKHRLFLICCFSKQSWMNILFMHHLVHRQDLWDKQLEVELPSKEHRYF